MADFKNEFSWSASRDVLFQECRRKYYYNYYGYWGGWERYNSDETSRTLYVLKNLKNRYLWKGTTVHHEISRILKQLTSTGNLTPLETSLNRVTRLMRQEFRSSRDKAYWDHDGSLRKINYLFEHEYEIVTPDEYWKKNHEEVIKCINNFYKSDILEKIKTLDREAILTIDKMAPSSFSFNREKIFVNLDLAYRVDDGIEIVDWKTGSGDSDTLQFMVYTLYAHEHFGAPLHNISLIEYKLFSEEKTIHKFGESEIDGVKNYINNRIDSMKSVLKDPQENSALITDFPRTEDQWKCNSCNFKKICFDLP